MKFFDLFRRDETPPTPSTEALEARADVTQNLKPRAEAAARERTWLMGENGWGVKIRELYRGEA